MIKVMITKASDFVFEEERNFESLEQCLKTLVDEYAGEIDDVGRFVVCTKEAFEYEIPVDYYVQIYDSYIE